MPLVPLATGIATHLAVRPYEIDRYLSRITCFFIISFACLFASLFQFRGHNVIQALFKSSTVALSFFTGFFGSTVVYRAFFHRLRDFPGDFLATITRFHAFKIAVTTLKSHIAAEDAHEKYGDFVRVGPRELSIKRAAAVSAIYGANSKCYRSVLYDNPSSNPAKSSIVGTRDPEVHRRRKRAWERGLGFKALGIYEPRVISKVDLLLSRLSRSENISLDVTELCKFFGFDAMGEVGYSKDFNMLASGQNHAAITGVGVQNVFVATLGCVPWLSHIVVTCMQFLNKFGMKASFSIFLDWCMEQLEVKRKILHDEQEMGIDRDPQDVMSWLIKAQDEDDDSAPPGEGAINEDSRVLIVAGSDTTSGALANSFYYLAQNATVYQKLQEILDAEFPGGESGWTYAKAKNIRYLEYIINETLRLRPPVPSGLPRTTPPDGLQIDEVFVPGDTIVSVPAHAIQRDPRYWDKPLDFIPERWETLTPEKTPFFPFTKGKYACPGKNLAMMEMMMVISRVALRYQIGGLKKDIAERFENEALDTFSMTVPPLPLVFKRR
ncbi:unnamed protein product [Discula destructiva]